MNNQPKKSEADTSGLSLSEKIAHLRKTVEQAKTAPLWKKGELAENAMEQLLSVITAMANQIELQPPQSGLGDA